MKILNVKDWLEAQKSKAQFRVIPVNKVVRLADDVTFNLLETVIPIRGIVGPSVQNCQATIEYFHKDLIHVEVFIHSHTKGVDSFYIKPPLEINQIVKFAQESALKPF